MVTRSRHAIAAIIMGAAAFSLAAPAQATPVVMLTSGATTITITDNMAGDLDPTAGAVAWFGSVGVFTTSITLGSTKPLVGGATDPVMHVGTNAVNGGGAGSLTVQFSETGFTAAPPINFLTSIGGAGPFTTASYATYLDATNALFGTGTLISDLGTVDPAGGTAFAEAANAIVSPSASPFSITQIITLDVSAKGQSISFDADLRVPEPGTLAIMGIGLFGLGFLRRRQQKRAAA